MENQMKLERKFIYDVYLSYSSADRDFALEIAEALRNEGISVCFDLDFLNGGSDYIKHITEVISSAKAFLPIITHKYAASQICMNELDFALDKARERAKLILPVCTSHDVFASSPELRYLLGRMHCIVTDGETEKEARRVAVDLARIIKKQKDENSFYIKLSEYIQAGAKARASELICNYLPEFCEILSNSTLQKQKALFLELFALLERLHSLYDYDYGEGARELGHKRNDSAGSFYSLLELPVFKTDDLFYLACALRIIYYYRETRYDGIDAMTHGDLSDGIINAVPVGEYIALQRPYLERFTRQCEIQNIFHGERSSYTESDIEFITATEKFIYFENTVPKAPPKTRVQDTPAPTQDSELLQSVAAFMREGNKLFDIIGEKHYASEFIRCLILSYERLKAYCEVIGEKEICAQCIDRILELKEKLDSAIPEENALETANNGIKTLLGLAQRKSGSFDLFISHKSDDVDIAEDLYLFMKRNMKEAFYDKESLPEMSESQYRKAIMQALDGSKHFVVIFSDLAYLESYWVKLEMEIFQSEIDEGRKKDSNFIMVVTNSVFEQIMSSNKSVLPIDFRRCEIMRVDEYKSKLLNYIK